jgi:hypothetical protein
MGEARGVDGIVSERIPSPAKSLLVAVTACLDERYPMWRSFPDVLPAGLRLELHPGAFNRVYADAGIAEWAAGVQLGEEWFRKTLGVPVKIESGLPPFGWRLAIVTEDVLIGGAL